MTPTEDEQQSLADQVERQAPLIGSLLHQLDAVCEVAGLDRAVLLYGLWVNLIYELVSGGVHPCALAADCHYHAHEAEKTETEETPGAVSRGGKDARDYL